MTSLLFFVVLWRFVVVTGQLHSDRNGHHFTYEINQHPTEHRQHVVVVPKALRYHNDAYLREPADLADTTFKEIVRISREPIINRPRGDERRSSEEVFFEPRGSDPPRHNTIRPVPDVSAGSIVWHKVPSISMSNSRLLDSLAFDSTAAIIGSLFLPPPPMMLRGRKVAYEEKRPKPLPFIPVSNLYPVREDMILPLPNLRQERVPYLNPALETRSPTERPSRIREDFAVPVPGRYLDRKGNLTPREPFSQSKESEELRHSEESSHEQFVDETRKLYYVEKNGLESKASSTKDLRFQVSPVENKVREDNLTSYGVIVTESLQNKSSSSRSTVGKLLEPLIAIPLVETEWEPDYADPNEDTLLTTSDTVDENLSTLSTTTEVPLATLTLIENLLKRPSRFDMNPLLLPNYQKQTGLKEPELASLSSAENAIQEVTTQLQTAGNQSSLAVSLNVSASPKLEPDNVSAVPELSQQDNYNMYETSAPQDDTTETTRSIAEVETPAPTEMTDSVQSEPKTTSSTSETSLEYLQHQPIEDNKGESSSTAKPLETAPSAPSLPTTTPIVKTVAHRHLQERQLCNGDCRLAATLRIIGGVKWVPEFADHNTREFEQLAIRLERKLTDTFQNGPLGPWFDSVEVEAFSQGSIIVDYYLNLNDAEEVYSDTVKQYFHLSLRSSEKGLRLGHFVIDPFSTDFAVLEKVNIPTTEPHSSNVEEFNEGLGDWVVAVIVTGTASLCFVVAFGTFMLIKRRRDFLKSAKFHLTADILNGLKSQISKADNVTQVDNLNHLESTSQANCEDGEIWVDESQLNKKTEPPQRPASVASFRCHRSIDDLKAAWQSNWKEEWNGSTSSPHYRRRAATEPRRHGRHSSAELHRPAMAYEFTFF